MEKSCKWCKHYDSKEKYCTKLESGFKFDKEKTIKELTEELEDEILSELACLEQDQDDILDEIPNIKMSQIIDIGCLFRDFRDVIGRRIKNVLTDNLDWVEYNGLKSITDDEEFYCKYWG